MEFPLATALTISAWAIRVTLLANLDVQVRVAHRTPCGGVVVFYDEDFTEPHDVWPGDQQAGWLPVSAEQLEEKFSGKEHTS